MENVGSFITTLMRLRVAKTEKFGLQRKEGFRKSSIAPLVFKKAHYYGGRNRTLPPSNRV